MPHGALPDHSATATFAERARSAQSAQVAEEAERRGRPRPGANKDGGGRGAPRGAARDYVGGTAREGCAIGARSQPKLGRGAVSGTATRGSQYCETGPMSRA